MEKAIELDPEDQIALRGFIVCLLSQVDYSTHHLPVGYLGSPMKDLDVLQRAENLLPGISNEDDRTAYAAEIAEQKGLIREYLRKHP